VQVIRPAGDEEAQMSSSRRNRLREMVQKYPQDSQARYFLAHELCRAEDWEDAAHHLGVYLTLQPEDEGAGYKQHGLCLQKIGRTEEAADAYRRAIAAATARHHEGFADEVRELLEALEE